MIGLGDIGLRFGLLRPTGSHIVGRRQAIIDIHRRRIILTSPHVF